MDERVMKKCVGGPVPQWDMNHRLSIKKPAGPEVKDLGTVFCVNSTFMDVAEPSLFDKQWAIMGVVIAFCFSCGGPYIYYFTHANGSSGDFIMNCIALAIVYLFGSIVWRLGGGLFFGLRYKPIRASFTRLGRGVFFRNQGRATSSGKPHGPRSLFSVCIVNLLRTERNFIFGTTPLMTMVM